MRVSRLLPAICTGLALLALGSAGLHAQTISDVIPRTGSPGDVILIRGASLQTVGQVEFRGLVGGFVGVLTANATPLHTQADLVVVQVPAFNAFAPLGTSSPGSPLGELRVIGAGTSAYTGFYLFEGHQPLGSMGTVGAGSPLPPPALETPFLTFDTQASSAPTSGNPNAELRLVNGLPTAVSALVIGAELATPIPFSGGLLAVNPGLAITLASVTGPSGEAAIPTPIPPGISGTVVFQWAQIDMLALDVKLSNGLRSVL